ncbi:RNA 2'-phosphotransferase [Thermococcus sp. M39]|uniref:RNA 2'-phosphotransferase n=1 Tax=unclassified Thermococcus TaxID=2627626 RepID=UPI00143A24A0|nr:MULTISPECIES: RNA 2'-phosphotransferase [unclassified Thermococcus]NJE07852.1 RNA 2'-phosphotransferase [Thermococcus sp. M39]NJE13437.1 RNA 2'-phosphotransferase [Thermococcus sp. LS2]
MGDIYIHNGKFTEERKGKLFLDSRRRVKLSKLMSYILRHSPWEFNLEPDEMGFVELNEFIRALRDVYPWVSGEHVKAVVELDPKGRFEIRGDKIRARYGHSFEVLLDHEEDKESKTLYHGTPRKNLAKILKEGLKPMKRKFVHLTKSKREAYETGLRHGKDVVVLIIDADCLRRKGYKIYKAGKNVRIVKFVPKECIIFYE